MKDMKRIVGILIGVFLFSPSIILAQNVMERNSTLEVEWEELDGYSDLVISCNQGYYDENDYWIKHGPCKVTFKEDLSSQVGQKLIITYNVSGNYVNNKLNGILTTEKSIITRSVSIKTNGKLNFNLDNPTGTWMFTETVTANGQSETDKVTLSFQDNRSVVINSKDLNFKVNNGNVTFSGTINWEVYKNNVNTSKFIRTKSGIWEHCNVNDEAKSLINAYIAGSMSESDLIAKGYAFDKNKEYNFNYTGGLYSYMEKLQVRDFWGKYNSCLSLILPDDKPVLLTLKTVHVKSAEELIAIAGTIKNVPLDEFVSAADADAYRAGVIDAQAAEIAQNMADNAADYAADYGVVDFDYAAAYSAAARNLAEYVKLKSSDDGADLSWKVRDDPSDFYPSSYVYKYNQNTIEVNGGVYYFTDEAKLQFQKAIMQSLEYRRLERARIAEEKRLEQERIAEERRIEQERLAEERRLREIEMQKKRLQPICDFLVLQKTSQKIAYDLSAINYFEPDVAGIGWQSDLKKAIKPFCEIVDCKIISLDKGLFVTKAVLEITKYVSKKKGTIKYHVPVSIYDDRILISSMNILNAIIVE